MRFFRILFVLVLLVILAVVFAYLLLPKMIISSTKDKNIISEVIPPELNEPIKESAAQIPVIIKEMEISESSAVDMVDKITFKKIDRILQELNATGIRSNDQALDVGFKHIPVEDSIQQKVRNYINSRVSTSQLQKALDLANTHRNKIPLLLPTAKSTLKRIIENPELMEFYENQYIRSMKK